jgi:hypothetical protein
MAVTSSIVDVGCRVRIGVERDTAVTVGVLPGGIVDVVRFKVGVLRVMLVGQFGLLRGHALLG